MNLDALNLEALRPILPLDLMVKLGILLGTAVLIVAIYYFMFWAPLQELVDAAEVKVESQQGEIVKKRQTVQKIPELQAELKHLEKQLKVALSLLPIKAQIPELLESVTWAGKDSGLLFRVFKPGTESIKAIYAEVPVSISLEGTFRQLLSFLRRVGAMPRIVAIKKLKISAGKKPGRLTISGLLLTYRFIESGNDAKPAPRRRSGR